MPEHTSETATTAQPPHRILVLALSGIGDALMFSPALRAIRNRFPDAHIDLLTMFRGVADMYRSNSAASNVLFWNFLKESPLSSIRFLLSLRAKRYDVSITVFPANRWPYSIISRIIGAQRRLGHDYLHANVRSLNVLNNIRVDEDDALHNVEENLRLAELLGAPRPAYPALELTVPHAAQQQAGTWLAERGLNGKLVVGIHAGSAVFKNQINKRWSPEGYAEVSKRLIEQHGAAVLLFGGPEEEELNLSIERMTDGAAIIVRSPDFLTAIALMQRCGLFVSNDSGLMHVAAALDLPTVAVFGYTSHIHTRPWCSRSEVVRHDLPCSPCFYFSPKPAQCKWSGDDEFMCIRRITPDEVYAACERLLG